MSKARSIRFLVPVLAVTLISALPAPMKDLTGVYALIDRVVFEPNADQPERVQLWGVFSTSNLFELVDGVVESIEMDRFHAPRRGYMYFQVNALDPSGTLAEWAELAQLAGTGQPVAFGSASPPPWAYTASDDASPYVIRIDPRDPSTIQWVARYNGRVRAARESVAAPDTFPLRGPGVALRAYASRSAAVTPLYWVPAPTSPADGAIVDSGEVELITGNVRAETKYVFEIEDELGTIERSAPIEAGDGTTSWKPEMRIEPDREYTWRVWSTPALDAEIPPAVSVFRGAPTRRGTGQIQ